MIFSRGRLGTALHEGWEILHLSPRKPLGKSFLLLCDLRDTSARRTRTPIDTLQRLISTNNMLSLISTLVARSDGPRNAKLAVDPLVIYERMFFSFGWSRGLTGFRERPSPNEKDERAALRRSRCPSKKNRYVRDWERSCARARAFRFDGSSARFRIDRRSSLQFERGCCCCDSVGGNGEIGECRGQDKGKKIDERGGRGRVPQGQERRKVELRGGRRETAGNGRRSEGVHDNPVDPLSNSPLRIINSPTKWPTIPAVDRGSSIDAFHEPLFSVSTFHAVKGEPSSRGRTTAREVYAPLRRLPA